MSTTSAINVILQQMKKVAPPAGTAPAPAAPAKNNEEAAEAGAVGGAGAGAAPITPVITRYSFPNGILSGAKALAYSQKKGLPPPFINNGGDPGPYVIIGHGFEQLVPFGERTIVPPGITLVTNILAGVGSTMPQTCGMINMLSREENRAMVSNPVSARFNMKRTLVEDEVEHLHVYTEGQRMPKLMVKLLGNFSGSVQKEVGGKIQKISYNKIFRSGVHKFPIQPFEGDDEIHISHRLANITANNVRTQNLGYTRGHERKCLHFEKRFPNTNLNVDDIHEIYKDSLHPTPEYITSIVDQINTKDVSVDALGELLGEIPITDIFEHNGPGIYYFIACRADKSEREHVRFQNLIGDLQRILHPDWIYFINDDGVEKTDLEASKFYNEFRISPYEVEFVHELIEFINSLLLSPIDMETKKLIVRQRLDELPESVDRALHSKKYFSESFVDEFIRFVDRTSAPKQLIRQASLEQQVRNRNGGADAGAEAAPGGGGGGGGGGGAPRRRTRGGGRRGRRVSLRRRRNRN